MRQPARAEPSTPSALVGIATEPVSGFGRAILRGVMRYANLQRRWILYKDLWRGIVDAAPWPDCDGSVVGGVRAEVFDDVRRHSRHVVACSGFADPADQPVICLDDDATGAMAAQHLIEKGLKHFGFYGPVDANDYDLTARPFSTFARRARGYQQALRRHGFACISSDVDTTNFYADMLTHAHHPHLMRWLDSLPKPIGIMAVDDVHAHDLAEVCREAGVGVPDQVAIIGINNDELLCESAWPPLSSVECDFSRMGYLAARTLERLLNGETLAPEERLVELPPIRVEARMSTDILAVDQPEVVEAVRYIRAHACDPCSVADVLDAVPVSRRKLEQLFAARLGRSLFDEISRVRLETARRLLVQPALPIDEVAERCGFATVPSFIRFFRNLTDTTPAAFRRASLRGSAAGR